MLMYQLYISIEDIRLLVDSLPGQITMACSCRSFLNHQIIIKMPCTEKELVQDSVTSGVLSDRRRRDESPSSDSSLITLKIPKSYLFCAVWAVVCGVVVLYFERHQVP